MSFRAIAAMILFSLSTVPAKAASAANPAGEYAKHFGALSGLSVAVAEAMPPGLYDFHPHPESMDFGQLMSHIGTTNYLFCAGLKDSAPPNLPSPVGKEAIVKFLV